MDTNAAMSTPPQPLQVYRNWLASSRGVASRSTDEYLLYTDSSPSGSPVSYGPYLVLPVISWGPAQALWPGITLRVDFHLQPEAGSLGRENLADDFSVLFSLCHRMRLRAGSLSRWFPPNEPRGRPLALTIRAEPVLVGPALRRPVLPDLAGSKRENTRSEILDTLPLLSPEQARAVLRAAHLYRDAIWLAEGEPEFSWLMLVSAIESAAKLWAPELGTHKRFTTFIDTFLPAPPPQRPDEPFQYPWDHANIGWSMDQIYDWRSRALHEGEPFPETLCMAPSIHLPEEKPLGTEEKTPTEDDPMPMLLHTFEYIVRHALLKWWHSMSPPQAPHDAHASSEQLI